MKLFNLKNGALLVDAICAFGLSVTVLCVLLPFTYPVGSFEAYLILTATTSTAAVVFSRKWWILPAFLGVLIPVMLITLKLVDPERKFFELIQNFDPFAFSGQDSHTAADPDFTVFILRLLIVLAVTGLCFLFYRRLYLFILLPLIMAAAFVFLFFQFRDTLMDVLPIMLFVLFVSLSKTRGKKSARIDDKKSRDPEYYHLLSAAAILPVVILLSLAFAPQKDETWKMKALGNFVEDISDITKWGNPGATPGGLFDISSFGFNPLGDRLGGDVILKDDAALYVKTDHPVPLRGTVFDTYDGKHWYDGYWLSRFRFNSFITSSKRKEVFLPDIPSGSKKIHALRSELLVDIQLSIRSVFFGRTLFASGKVNKFSTDYNIDDSYAFFNEQGELFLTDKAYSFLWYEIETGYFDRTLPGFDWNMLELEKLTIDSDDKQYKNIANIYLQLPDTLPERVLRIADEITANIDSPYEKALAIEKWLAENSTYTLSPGTPPEDADFVDYFLETGEGYCVYYASAMTVLSRCNGLPARYVTGFLLKRNPYLPVGPNYIATYATAHAWTEIYFRGIGWISFDPLVSNPYELGYIAVPDQSNRDPTPKPSPTPPDETTPTDPGELYPNRISNSMLASIFSAVIVFALIVYACIRAILLFAKPERLRKWLSSLYPDISAQVEACYQRILRQFAYLGYSYQPGDTIFSFLKRVDTVWFDGPERDIFDAVIQLRFALSEPTEKDLIRMCVYTTSLEKRLIRARGFIRYLIRRLLIGPI